MHLSVQIAYNVIKTGIHVARDGFPNAVTRFFGFPASSRT